MIPSLAIDITRQFGQPIQAVDGVIAPPHGTAQEKFQVYLETGGETHLPGNPSDGTFFIDGHTYSDPSVEGGFDALQPLFTELWHGNVPADMQARLTMPTGQKLVYVLTEAKLVRKDTLSYSEDIYQYTLPGHGRIFACALTPEGKPSAYNLVMFARLVGVEGP